MKKSESVVPQEQAIKEFQEFYEYHMDEEISVEDIHSNHKQTLKALVQGRLSFTDYNFKLTLRESVKDTEGEVFRTEISSKRTRIKPQEQRRIYKGINPATDFTSYLINSACFIVGEEPVILGNLNKHDLKLVMELIPLFL